MRLKQYLPDFALVVVADGIRYAVEPTPFAYVELERHYDNTSWAKLLGFGMRAEAIFKLCHLELQMSGVYEGTLPPFNDWLATVTEFYTLEPDDDDDEKADASLADRAVDAVGDHIAEQVDANVQADADALVDAAIANA